VVALSNPPSILKYVVQGNQLIQGAGLSASPYLQLDTTIGYHAGLII
jgi:hypothetical protein